MRLPLLLAAFAAVLAPAAPGALEPEGALRLGVGAGLGAAASDVPMTDIAPVQYPLQLDLLGRQGPVAVGAYGALALASPGRCARASCSAWAARVGLQATWTFRTAGGSAPWVGLASGYEWLAEDRRQGGTLTIGYRGLEPIAVQAGIDWRVLPWLGLGPYALLSLGEYARYSVDTGIERASVEIPHRALHAWLHLGVRGRLLLGARP